MDADKNEGCEIKGTIDLPAVSGNFHVAPGRHLKAANAFQGLDVVLLTFEQFNVSHVIKRIAFGPGDADDVDNVPEAASKSPSRRDEARFELRAAPSFLRFSKEHERASSRTSRRYATTPRSTAGGGTGATGGRRPWPST